jgi:hypothetical protein
VPRVPSTMRWNPRRAPGCGTAGASLEAISSPRELPPGAVPNCGFAEGRVVRHPAPSTLDRVVGPVAALGVELTPTERTS